MFHRFDDLLFDRVFDLICDFFGSRYDKDNWWLAQQSLIVAAAFYVVALILLLFQGDREHLLIPSLLNAFFVLMGFRRAFSDLGEARRLHRPGFMNVRRQDGFAMRMIIIAATVLSPPFLVVLGRIGALNEGFRADLAVMLCIAIFVPLAAGHYFMACTPRPPKPKPLKVPGGLAAVSEAV